MTTRYDSTPVIGYSEGLVIAPGRETPTRIVVAGNPNLWFYIDLRRYNVHPYREDLGGYPVRWSEAI